MNIADCRNALATVSLDALDGSALVRVFGDDGSIVTGAVTLGITAFGLDRRTLLADHVAVPAGPCVIDREPLSLPRYRLVRVGEPALLRIHVEGLMLRHESATFLVTVDLPERPALPAEPKPPPSPEALEAAAAMATLLRLGPEVTRQGLATLREADRDRLRVEVDEEPASSESYRDWDDGAWRPGDDED